MEPPKGARSNARTGFFLPDDPHSDEGLSELEAHERLKRFGPNELPANKPRSPFAIALTVLAEPMFLLLLACVVIYSFLGDRTEAAMLGGAVGVVIVITFVQERKTERALEALRDLSSPRALVVRDGETRRIPGREVVPGDLVLLAEGDRVPADALLLSTLSLEVDESLLTGESVPVTKSPWRRDSPAILEDRESSVFSGTLVVRGQGTATVLATGAATEIGAIGKSLGEIGQEPTLLQRTTARLVRNFAILGLTLCAIVAIVYSLARGDWLTGLLAGMTMAISAIPEEFPVILTVFLALGAWRIAQKNVLTRRVAAVETLGAATVLCVDKTGTLTKNRMTVATLWAGGQVLDVLQASDGRRLPAAHERLASLAAYASAENPFDPMEQAIAAFAKELPELSPKPDRLVRQYAVSPELLVLSQVWEVAEDNSLLLAMKGAPEAVADRCGIGGPPLAAMVKAAEDLAGQGYRVLGVAEQVLTPGPLPDSQTSFTPTFLGLIALADPPRPNVAASLKRCYSAGIRVVMVTGDYPGTARSIASQIGLRAPDEVITGADLASLSDDELARRIKSVNIFARITPQQKLLLVNTLKSSGEVVAMTGDGVNDAPALRASNIGIAMGMRGTDVAREAADLVLLDDDFSSIVGAVSLGRRIYTNIKDAMSYVLAIHIPIAGLSLFPVLFGWPLILLPVHILLLELVIDPACSIVFEAMPEESDIMNRPPRTPAEPLFTRPVLGLCILQGVAVLAVCLAVFQIALSLQRGADEARALTYATMLLANLGLIVTNLSWTRSAWHSLLAPNAALRIILVLVLTSLAIVLFVPPVRSVFKFSTLHFDDLLLCVGLAALSLVWFEIVKLVRRRAARRNDPLSLS